ncbi:CoA-binding protein [Kyrpidia spormannii]|uniref:CoA-binding protein n=2 Tax=Kyrpidia spormannii TaxID=2055160 RepID=A0A2K8N610_9BACL|nr:MULTISPECIES: CoA-binding protein [Kyrpidia]ATY84766.1 CoA-binding protein [Kyrpidia spormannii]MCL6575526.1 CoA-binding protein [Kyrpidia sp.]CAB3391898.1 putative CoA-binding protein [Kyrpidia spormannii]CAB3392817.1 putative CoA-binding protein [Kyrpidia spormannii]
MFQNPTDQELANLLKTSKTVAVVGLSDNPDRPSYEVASYLQSQGYEIIPVNPRIGQSLGRKAHRSLREVEGPVDIVDVFRRGEEVDELVDQAVQAGAKVLWMQLGVVNEQAAKRAQDAGLTVVMDRCMKIEHQRLLGGAEL